MSQAPLAEIYRSVSGIIVRRLPLKETGLSGLGFKDTRRKPTEKLYLLVKKPRKNHAWQFPQGGQEKNETAAEAALRELREECGSDLKVNLVDNSAIGVYQYKFPAKFVASRKRKDGSIGAKVSFFRADWISGQCQPDGEEIIDFAWLTQQELTEYIDDEYKEAIKPFLL
ncbi:NUDIX hydrolase domain-like protein [Mucor mucedo]|uniref:NUDIX hydrolase domain-like protein n=1 Tax=Mucor mucedo TaxID=29922 RepID=UPI002220DB7E|nr:NUDIX hydrolase domain-like protein [Mucor mucedo]KAI7892224.1 NUDIX hydrolase domain-like protein [Mucor mucedo]